MATTENSQRSTAQRYAPGNIQDFLKQKSGDLPWKCSKCGQMLGVVSSDKTQVRIKYKDLFVFIEGGNVTTLCRKCGYPNTLTDQPTEEEKAAEEVHNSTSVDN